MEILSSCGVCYVVCCCSFTRHGVALLFFFYWHLNCTYTHSRLLPSASFYQTTRRTRHNTLTDMTWAGTILKNIIESCLPAWLHRVLLLCFVDSSCHSRQRRHSKRKHRTNGKHTRPDVIHTGSLVSPVPSQELVPLRVHVGEIERLR